MSDLFQEFKNKTGLRTQDLERETGYTRQGLIYSFNRLETEGECSRSFNAALNNLVRRLLIEESSRNIQRINELKAIRNKVDNK